jgi:predicted  nucleic acid-binding Zn-ribbon protein
MNAGFLALNNNYNALSGRVDDIYKRLEDALAALPDLGQLKANVLKNQKDILDLQTKYDELNGKIDKFVTITEVENMLADYYNKEEINQLLAGIYEQLGNVPNRDEMNKLIEEATKEIKDQLALMQGEIDELKNKCTELEEKVDRLFNRIQSMVIIPQYSSNEEVELKPREGNKYELNVNVKINPADVLNEVTALEGYFHIDSREAIPTRGAGDAGPAFTVEKVAVKDAAEGIFTVTATCELPTVDPVTHKMPFTVAVEFENSNNNRSTSYKGVRYVPAQSEDQTTYEFKSGTEVVRTKADLGLSAFAEEDIYKHAVLGEVKNVDTKVIQIVDNLPVFATEVLGSSTANESNQNIPVVYSLGIIYDEAGKPQPDLANYIKVDMHNGALSMGLTLDPSRVTDDLTGYKVVIGLQARKDGINYGEPAYICVELQKK